MTHTPPPPIFADLMAKVGGFLLYWSSFELELGEAIKQLRLSLREAPGDVRGGLKERLDIWVELMRRREPDHIGIADEVRAQALELRDIRNLMVHGLIGGNARPRDGSPAHIRCAVGGFDAPTGEFKTYTIDQLEHFIQCADACRRATARLSNFNYRLHPETPHQGQS